MKTMILLISIFLSFIGGYYFSQSQIYIGKKAEYYRGFNDGGCFVGKQLTGKNTCVVIDGDVKDNKFEKAFSIE